MIHEVWSSQSETWSPKLRSKTLWNLYKVGISANKTEISSSRKISLASNFGICKSQIQDNETTLKSKGGWQKLFIQN